VLPALIARRQQVAAGAGTSKQHYQQGKEAAEQEETAVQ